MANEIVTVLEWIFQDFGHWLGTCLLISSFRLVGFPLSSYFKSDK